MPRFDLNALIKKTSGERLKSGRASKSQVKRARTSFTQTVRKSPSKVKFTTKAGEQVSFTVSGKRDAKKQGRTNAYARFVRDNIGKYLPDGASPWQARVAMKKVAADWNRRKSRRAA
jgi:hypothetical protein